MQNEGTSQRALPMRGVPQPSRESVLSLSDVHISRHPVIEHKMTALRDRETTAPDFYRLVRELGTLLAYEATADLRTQTVHIQTPLESTDGQRLAGGVCLVHASLTVASPTLRSSGSRANRVPWFRPCNGSR